MDNKDIINANKLTLKENINKNDGSSSNNNINNSIKNNEKKIRIDLIEDNNENINAFIVIDNPNYLMENNINNNNIKDIIEKADIKYYEFINNDSAKTKEIPLQNIDNKSLINLKYLAEKIKEYDETKENDKNNKEKLDKLNKEIKDKINDINKKQIELSYDLEENKHLTITKNLNFHSISYSEIDDYNCKQNNVITFYYDGDRYEGEFKDDMREGKGIYYYDNGSIYKGEFRKGLKEGKGIFYHINGERYEGDFIEDYPKKGIYYYNDGDIEIREYNSDEYSKTILYYSKKYDKIYDKHKSDKDKIEINDSNILSIEDERYDEKDYEELKKRVYKEKYPLLYEIIRTCEEDNCDNDINNDRYETIENDNSEVIKQQYVKDSYTIQRKKQNTDDNDNYSFYIKSNDNSISNSNNRFGVIIYRPREDAQTFLNNFKSRTTVNTDILKDNDRFILLGYTTDYFGRFDTTLSELNTIKEKLENGEELSDREKNRLNKLSMVQQKMGLVRGNGQQRGRG